MCTKANSRLHVSGLYIQSAVVMLWSGYNHKLADFFMFLFTLWPSRQDCSQHSALHSCMMNVAIHCMPHAHTIYSVTGACYCYMHTRCSNSRYGWHIATGHGRHACSPYRLPALDRAVAASEVPAAGPLLKGDISPFIWEVCPSGVVG